MSAPVSAAFYFDLASPLAYLAAERVLHTLPVPAEWSPVLARELGAGAPVYESFRCEREQSAFREDVERSARRQGLPPVVWPVRFPFDSEAAMRAATYAKGIGRVVPFAQAAFRQAFAAGHALDEPDHVLIAAAACEMHPQALTQGQKLRSVAQELRRATEQAARVGVDGVPAVRLGERVWVGERAVEEAATHATGLLAAAPAQADGAVGRRRAPLEGER